MVHEVIAFEHEENIVCVSSIPGLGSSFTVIKIFFWSNKKGLPKYG